MTFARRHRRERLDLRLALPVAGAGQLQQRLCARAVFARAQCIPQTQPARQGKSAKPSRQMKALHALRVLDGRDLAACRVDNRRPPIHHVREPAPQPTPFVRRDELPPDKPGAPDTAFECPSLVASQSVQQQLLLFGKRPPGREQCCCCLRSVVAPRSVLTAIVSTWARQSLVQNGACRDQATRPTIS